MLSTIARLIVSVTLATLIACSGPSPAGAVTSVAIDGGDRTIVLGDTPTLTAIVAVTGTVSQAVAWASSNEAVATIAAGGQVTGLTAGTTVITATSAIDATKSDTVTLTITEADGVISVTIDGGDRVIVLGDTPTLSATVVVTGTASQAVTWASSNEAVATIAAGGQVTSLTAGITNITATSVTDATESDSITLTITAADGVVSVTIDGGDRVIVLGDTPTLSATVVVTGSADPTITWASSNTMVATIAPSGTITSLTAGTTNITATSVTDATESDTVNLTITEADGVVSVTIDGGDRTIVLGDALTLIATVATTGNASAAVTWSSSDEAVAAIAPNGQVSSLTDGTTNITATSSADATKSDTITLNINPTGALRWTRQFGTSEDDAAYGIATDASGHVYTTGVTYGDLDGSSAGGFDAFVRSYDSAGTLRWTRQLGTSSDDLANGIATDANGNVYTTGHTFGNLEGSSAGGSDAFIRSYAGDGNLRWTRQFGTSSDDRAFGIATDAGGHVYITGYTFGDLEGSNAGDADAFIRSYDSAGAYRWTRQFGSAGFEIAFGIAADASGHVYATGYTNGALEGSNAGSNDAFIRSYDRDGNLRWTRQFGTSGTDIANGIATDASGNVYASGNTNGALEGSSAGSTDAFIRLYDSAGNLRWTRQFGTSSDDRGSGIATDANDNVYAIGETFGVLEGSNAGARDAFIRSYER